MLNNNQARTLRKYLPNGALFDLIMFCLFAGLMRFVKPLLDGQIVYTATNQKYLGWQVGIVYVSAALAQIAGFWLKRRRIAQSFNHHNYTAAETLPLLGGICIAVLHFMLFGVLMVNDGIKYINNQGNWWLTTIKTIAIILPTTTALIVTYSARQHKEVERLSALNTIGDVTGTILLAFSCFVVVGCYWELLLGNINLNFRDGKTLINLLLSIAFFFSFLFLYLPARWAFLVMDYRQPYTWLRMVIVFLPFLKSLWIGW